jgi:hypothetical protein
MQISSNIKARYGFTATNGLNVFPERLSAGTDHDDFLMVLEKIFKSGILINKYKEGYDASGLGFDPSSYQGRPFYSLLQMSIPLIRQIEPRRYKLMAGILVWNGLIFRDGSSIQFDTQTGKLLGENLETASIVNATFSEMTYDVYYEDKTDIPKDVLEELDIPVDYSDFPLKDDPDEIDNDLIKYISIYAPELDEAKDADTYVACYTPRMGLIELLTGLMTNSEGDINEWWRDTDEAINEWRQGSDEAINEWWEELGFYSNYDQCFVEFTRKGQPFAYALLEYMLGRTYRTGKEDEYIIEDAYAEAFDNRWIKEVAHSEEKATDKKMTLNSYLKAYKEIIESNKG